MAAKPHASDFESMKLTALAILAIAASALADEPAPVECRRAAGPMIIDGKLDEPAWALAQVVTFQMAWMPEGQRTPPTQTKR